MTLQELQAMIKEEFNHFVNEQPGGGPGMPPMPPAPGIEVGPGDIDAMEPPMGGPEGAEAQLQKIFGMLKSYFEGGEEGMEPDMDMSEPDMTDDDMTDPEGEMTPPSPDMGDIEVDAEEDEEETVDEAYGETKGGNATKSSGKYGGAYGATGTDTGNAQLHEGLKSRMQKLANIRK